MKVPKIIEAARAVALENLVPPDITVITRDKKGHVQLWWKEKRGQSARQMALTVYHSLKLSTAGHWLVEEAEGVKCFSLGQDISCKYPLCRRLEDMETRQGSISSAYDENMFVKSDFVSGILKHIFDGTYRKPEAQTVVKLASTGYIAGMINTQIESQDLIKSVTGDNYDIQTVYKVDGLTFDNLEDAQTHVKGVKLFDLILAAEPDADYFVYQTAIESLLKNSDKVIDILKGGK